MATRSAGGPGSSAITAAAVVRRTVPPGTGTSDASEPGQPARGATPTEAAGQARAASRPRQADVDA